MIVEEVSDFRDDPSSNVLCNNQTESLSITLLLSFGFLSSRFLLQHPKPFIHSYQALVYDTWPCLFVVGEHPSIHIQPALGVIKFP